MKIAITSVLDVPQEHLAALYKFMQTSREGVRDCLNEEAAIYIHEYLADNNIPNTLIRTWEK